MSTQAMPPLVNSWQHWALQMKTAWLAMWVRVVEEAQRKHRSAFQAFTGWDAPLLFVANLHTRLLQKLQAQREETTRALLCSCMY
jgi:hypothetical protein